MAPSLEFEATNVEKALTAASTKLKKTKENLKYEIISYGSTGIFGLVGRKKAKIRVTIEEKCGQPKKQTKAIKNQSKKIVTTEIRQKDEIVVDKGDQNTTKVNLEDVVDNLKDHIADGVEALKTIVDYISEDAEIRVNLEKGFIYYQVSGGETSRLIGKRGQTLEAIQYILEKIVNQKLEKRVRVKVDIEDYLKNKEIKLVGMAEKLADKAKKTGKPVSMGQLNAHDRRIVHIALKIDTNVRTQSRGHGFFRKLIIFPKQTKNDTSHNFDKNAK